MESEYSLGSMSTRSHNLLESVMGMIMPLSPK